MIHDITKTEHSSPIIQGDCWKPIFGYEGVYEVGYSGNVRSVSGKCYLLRQRIDDNGRAYVMLSGVKKYLNTLVAKAFVPQKKHSMHIVFHKDGNPCNCCADNLEWRKPEKPTNLPPREERETHNLGRDSVKRPVKQMTIKGTVIARYDSMHAAESATGVCAGNISRVCAAKHKQLTAGGFRWRLSRKSKP